MKTYFRKMPGLLYDWISMASLKLNERCKWINSVTTIGKNQRTTTISRTGWSAMRHPMIRSKFSFICLTVRRPAVLWNFLLK